MSTSPATSGLPRVVVLRGHSANPWDLRQWAPLADRYDVDVVVTPSNMFGTDDLPLSQTTVRSVRDYLPRGRVGDLAAKLPGDRYLGLAEALRGADIVHSAEIGPWFSGQAAALRSELGFKLALTVWETIPFRETYRSFRGRRYRADALRHTDIFLPTTERARQCLQLEGIDDARLRVHPPGIDRDRFRPEGDPDAASGDHLILSPGRLVWEKGHQDVLRALAALERGLVEGPGGAPVPPARLLVVGSGPERKRLSRYADDLGVAPFVEFRDSVPYDEMPDLYARASCMVLGSLPIPMWEEQFGMVLAEAMASGTPVIAASSGAIPEVVGEPADLVAPGDWMGMAGALARGPLARPPGQRVSYEQERLHRYSAAAAAARLDEIYAELLGG